MESTQTSLSEFLAGDRGEIRRRAETLLEAPGVLDLEDLERRLTILDEKIHAALLTHASEELMLKIRREVDSQLAKLPAQNESGAVGVGGKTVFAEALAGRIPDTAIESLLLFVIPPFEESGRRKDRIEHVWLMSYSYQLRS